MKKDSILFVLNKHKFIIAKVKVYDITETHVRIQNIINNDVCPAILPIPIEQVESTLFGTYHTAKVEFGSYLWANYRQLDDTDIISMGEYNILMDIKTIKECIDYTEKYAPEKLV